MPLRKRKVKKKKRSTPKSIDRVWFEKSFLTPKKPANAASNTVKTGPAIIFRTTERNDERDSIERTESVAKKNGPMTVIPVISMKGMMTMNTTKKKKTFTKTGNFILLHCILCERCISLFA